MKKVLLVEDEFIISKDIQTFLEKENEYNVTTAKSYSQAKEKFNENSIDLIICDINLNGEKNGIDFIKDNIPTNKVPVVYLTAYSNPDIISKAKQTTPFSYLMKPFNEIQLKVTIELALLNYKKQQLNTKEDKENTKKLSLLTKREKEILIILSSGKTSKEIGFILNISKLTVDKHKKNIKEKLNLNTLGELINFSISSNLYKVS